MFNLGYYSNEFIGWGVLSGLIFGFLFFFLTMGITIWILTVIGRWKMFEKAGFEGWKSIIPFYNLYTHCQMVGVNVWWVAIYFGVLILNGILGPLAIVGYLVMIYFYVLLAVSTAKSFGKDESYGVGIFFVPTIFYMILGFGKSEFVGKKPMKDFIFDNISSNSTNVSPEDKEKIKEEIKKEVKEEIQKENKGKKENKK